MRRGSQRVESVMAAVEKVRARIRLRKEEMAKQTIEVSISFYGWKLQKKH